MEKKPYGKFKGFIAENGIKQEEIANLLEITRSTFNTKLNRNGLDFSLEEVRKLCTTFELDANEFFLI